MMDIVFLITGLAFFGICALAVGRWIDGLQ